MQFWDTVTKRIQVKNQYLCKVLSYYAVFSFMVVFMDMFYASQKYLLQLRTIFKQLATPTVKQ